MKFTSEMVDKYADKLLIGLTKEENEMFLSEFEIIENSMELIANIPGISEVTPMTHALDDFSYELTEDEVEESLYCEDLLRNCKCTEDREVVIPKVVGE